MKAKEIRNAYGCYEVWTGPKNGIRVASFTSKAKAHVFFDALTDDVISKLESHAALVSALEEAKHYLHFDFEASDEVMKRISDVLALAKGD